MGKSYKANQDYRPKKKGRVFVKDKDQKKYKLPKEVPPSWETIPLKEGQSIPDYT